MATRTLENRKDRIITILIIPLMSCGARLPVYVLLAGAFFGGRAGHVIFLMYVIGIGTAILAAVVFHKLLFPGQSSPFVMELPPYRMPTFRSIMILMWERAVIYLKKAGTIIFAVAVIIWFLTAFPVNYPGRAGLEKELSALEPKINAGGADSARLIEEERDLRNRMAGLRLENSVAGRIGRAVEPVFSPLGFDWRTSVAILTGIAAKEVIVSTLGTFYSIGSGEEETSSLGKALRSDPVFSPLTAFSLMLFVLISVPCSATLAVIKKETGSWRWPLFSAGYHFVLAWVVCFVVFQAGRLAGL